MLLEGGAPLPLILTTENPRDRIFRLERPNDLNPISVFARAIVQDALVSQEVQIEAFAPHVPLGGKCDKGRPPSGVVRLQLGGDGPVRSGACRDNTVEDRLAVLIDLDPIGATEFGDVDRSRRRHARGNAQ
jgi:hypothetical protein